MHKIFNCTWRAIEVSNSKESKSRSGFIFTIKKVVVSYKFSKQTCIARFVMDSKFIIEKDAKWLQNILEDI